MKYFLMVGLFICMWKPLYAQQTQQKESTTDSKSTEISDEEKLRRLIEKPIKVKPAKRKVNPAMRPIQETPGLPRVLLIGDSISIGYTTPVRKLLEGEMNVHRPLTNCGPSRKGVLELEKWLHDKRLGEGRWDVIHFNFGLHDLKYMGPNGENLADPKVGEQQVSLKEYERNLTYIVKELKKTKAKLVWRNTTPVPAGAKGRVVGDAVKYNKVAAKIMEAHDVRIHDMYSQVHPKKDELMQKANVHFTAKGSEFLAQTVVVEIRRMLERRDH